MNWTKKEPSEAKWEKRGKNETNKNWRRQIKCLDLLGKRMEYNNRRCDWKPETKKIKIAAKQKTQIELHRLHASDDNVRMKNTQEKKTQDDRNELMNYVWIEVYRTNDYLAKAYRNWNILKCLRETFSEFVDDIQRSFAVQRRPKSMLYTLCIFFLFLFAFIFQSTKFLWFSFFYPFDSVFF